MKFLVINGHKYYPYAEGRLNKTLFDKIIELVIQQKNEVQTTIVETGYDIDQEIEKYKWADIIIFQTPMNWFSIPWILKKYFDDIYQYDKLYTSSIKYGDGGLLKGKKYMYSITMNINQENFNNPDSFFDSKSPEDFISALHKTQQYIGLKPVKSYFCYDVIKNPDIDTFLKKLEEHLYTYVFDKL